MSHKRPATSDAMEQTPPFVLGGQGRSAEDVVAGAQALTVIFCTCVAMALGLWACWALAVTAAEAACPR